MVIATWTLPEELTLEWGKQPMGNQMVTDVDSLLESGNAWQSKFHSDWHDPSTKSMLGSVPGIQNGPVILFVSCMTSSALVSF